MAFVAGNASAHPVTDSFSGYGPARQVVRTSRRVSLADNHAVKPNCPCRKLLVCNPDDDETSLVLGRALLLQKKYPDALAVAKQLQQQNPKLAGAYLLEANVSFWNQQPDQAEAPLVRSLQLNPFNADARFMTRGGTD